MICESCRVRAAVCREYYNVLLLRIPEEGSKESRREF
jgi:hypothetical protein